MDDRKPMVVLSFDDGRADNYRIAMEELVPRKLKATFNITTGYVRGDMNISDLPCENEPLSVENVKELSRYKGFEIAGHGHEHLNTLEDWKKGIDVLTDWLGDEWKKCGNVGVASPHCGISAQEVKLYQNELSDMGVKYVRIGLVNQKDFLQRIIDKLARELKSKHLFYWASKTSLGVVEPRFVVYSIPILHAHTLEQITYMLEKAIKKNQDIVLMFHSVLKKTEQYYDSMWTWDYDKFVELCDYLVLLREQQRIEISTTMDMFS